MLNEQMYEYGSKSSVIRELFAYGLERRKIVGEDKVYDFSIGNPQHPGAGRSQGGGFVELLEEPAEALHGYSPAAGDPEVRKTLADVCEPEIRHALYGGQLLYDRRGGGIAEHHCESFNKTGG